MLAQVGDFKFCSKCKKLKPLTEFHKTNQFKSGLRPECAKCRCKFLKNLRKTNPEFRLAGRLRARLYRFVKKNSKPGSHVADLGCSLVELTAHLERQFKPGMSWENYGEWEIDHIRPLSSFKLTDRSQFLQAVHFSNLQPLWKSENRQKWNKL